MHRLDVEVAIYRDRVQVTETRSGNFADMRAEQAFSTDALLIADPAYFEQTLRLALRKAMAGSAFLLEQPTATITSIERPLTPDEHAAVLRAFAEAGFGDVGFGEGR